MPRENRKRGKKHKKKPEEEYDKETNVVPVNVPQHSEEPSWILQSTQKPTEDFNPEAPFGYVDADVKAYFRTVDVQIRDWQSNQTEAVAGTEDIDPNEQRRLFFVAAFTEMQGKENVLATDPDCSVILERMIYSMDDFIRRVFMDSLAGSYEILAKHRFASHVCQTVFSVARDTVSRETKGILHAVPNSSEKGELRTLTQLVLDISEELLARFPSLIMDPFASHVYRSLLLLLSPGLASDDGAQSIVRSKKSANWKAKQGTMKSVFNDEKGKGKEPLVKNVPSEFRVMARRFVEVLKEQMSDNEVRALAGSKVASPGLQVLLEVEADQDMTNEPGSLMDKIMVGIISSCHAGTKDSIEESDYLGTLLRDQTSSHLLEIIALRCPDDAFDVLWRLYFKGKLVRLGMHPVANFVLAKALERVTAEQLSEVFDEMKDSWGRLVRSSRTGVLRAIVDRAAILGAFGSQIEQTILSAFELRATEDHSLVVPCVLSLLPIQEYRNALSSREKKRGSNEGAMDGTNILEPTVQGAILLQSLLKFPDPHNKFVINSIRSMSIDDRIRIAHSASGSRVYDVLLESGSIPAKDKRQFVMDFIGHYHELVDDRIGSRICDRCWYFADTYLKEKIARSLIPHEQALAASFYGKFFARNLSLYVLQRRPEEWRNMQSSRKQPQENKSVASTHSVQKPKAADAVPESPPKGKRKRLRRGEDEIDELFNVSLGKKIKKAAIEREGNVEPVQHSGDGKGSTKQTSKKEKGDLDDILGAIRAAPSGSEKHRKNKKI